MSWAELGEKFRDCADLVLPRKDAEATIRLVRRLDELRSLSPLVRALSGGKNTSLGKQKTLNQEVKNGTVLANDSEIRQWVAGSKMCRRR